MATPLPPCPVCGAALVEQRHIDWHDRTGTLDGWTVAGALFAIQRPELIDDNDDTAQTVKFPPIRETVLRRPPPPEVRELKGRDLLLALARELADDEDLADEDDAR